MTDGSRGEEDRLTDQLREVVSGCDVCVVDLDGCVYPRFTQTTLGALILARSLCPRSARLIPRLAAGAVYLTAARFLRLFGRRPANADLMRNFSRAMEGVPMAVVEECAAKLPSLGPQGWRAALAGVARMMPVHLLTFAIEPIARAYAEARDARGRVIFSGFRGTPVEVRDGVFRGCLFGEDSFTPGAKGKELSEILRESGRTRPLVIGHCEDEAVMFGMADAAGGGSIALCRGGERAGSLGASIMIASWGAFSGALDGRAPGLKYSNDSP